MSIIKDKPETGDKSFCINANGHLFVVKRSTFLKLEPRLGHGDPAVSRDGGGGGRREEYFTDRHPQCLAAVLDYHQTGELHMPGDVCPSVFRRELHHWGLDRAHISRCCLQRYVEFLQNEATLSEFDQTFYSSAPLGTLKPDSRWESFRRRCWPLLDDPRSSAGAKVILAISTTFVILSIFVLAASTHPVFQRPLTVTEWLDLVSEDDCWEFLYPGTPRPNKTSTVSTTVHPLSRTAKVVKKREIHGNTKPEVEHPGDESPLINTLSDETNITSSNPHTPGDSTGRKSADQVRVVDITVLVNGQLVKVALPELLRGVSEDGGDDDGLDASLRRRLAAYFKSSDVELFPGETDSDDQRRRPDGSLGRFKRESSSGGNTDAANESDYVDLCDRERPKNTAVMHDWLRYLDFACMVYFTAELLLRSLFAPSLCRFLRSPSTVVDALSLLAMYLTLVLERLDAEAKYTSSYIDMVANMQVVRVFRFFRLVKDITGFQVLLYSLRTSWRELLLLLLYILIAVSVFSCVVYFMEREYMKSIPEAGWWAIVTMTTVGYGDIVPVTVQGKLVGCACALSGVLLIAVTVPVFVNNFLLFYGHSQMISDIDNRGDISKQEESRDEAGKGVKVAPEKVGNAWT